MTDEKDTNDAQQVRWTSCRRKQSRRLNDNLKNFTTEEERKWYDRLHWSKYPGTDRRELERRSEKCGGEGDLSRLDV